WSRCRPRNRRSILSWGTDCGIYPIPTPAVGCEPRLMSAMEAELRASSPRDTGQQRQASVAPHRLDPRRLPNHIDALHRAARALCGSRQDAEDLVQDTLANVLARSRLLRNENELGYLLQALRNTHANRARAASRRPRIVPL